jgi:hypothetical protein
MKTPIAFGSMTLQYKRSERYWIARYKDSIGHVGPIASGLSKEQAAFYLGILYGQYPSLFSRTIEELTKGEMK